MTPDADALIDEIDACRLRPMALAVVREMHRHMGLEDALQTEALTAFDRGDQPADMVALARRIRLKINALDPAEQSGLRLSSFLTRADHVIDWEVGEYLILWARQQGLSEQQIIEAFHKTGSAD